MKLWDRRPNQFWKEIRHPPPEAERRGVLQGCRNAKFSKQKQNNILLTVLNLERPPPTYYINITQQV